MRLLDKKDFTPCAFRRMGLLLIFLLSMPLFGMTQKEDYIWTLGTNVPGTMDTQNIGACVFDFSYEVLKLRKIKSEAQMNDANASICDPNGKSIRLFSNGCQIFGPDFKILDKINTNNYWCRDWGLQAPQYVLQLPFMLNKDHIYYSIYLDLDAPIRDSFIQANKLLVTKTEWNNGNVSNVYVDQLIYMDKFGHGNLTATRHANGRDWWIVLPKRYGKRMMVFLADPSGVRLHHQHEFETITWSGIGIAKFSPCGNYYAIGHSPGEKWQTFSSIDLYDFDRCSGDLSQKRQMIIPNKDTVMSGLEFSPNSEYIYFGNVLEQYRIRTDDIPDYTTAVKYADFTQGDPNDPFTCTFYQMTLGPDHRIYQASIASGHCLSVIEEPDEDNLSQIGWKENGIHLPVRNFRSLPNLPHFRLGPIDGSVCDSLGIDNVPMARFRYRADTTGGDYQRFFFRDLSAYEPRSWHWDFGDGSTSQERHPSHRYAEKKRYRVCLTVQNPYGSDTQCKDIDLGTTAVQDGKREVQINIQPQPASDILHVHIFDPLAEEIALIDLNGRTMLRTAINDEKNIRIDVSDLSAGIYILSVIKDHQTVHSQKITIIR